MRRLYTKLNIPSNCAHFLRRSPTRFLGTTTSSGSGTGADRSDSAPKQSPRSDLSGADVEIIAKALEKDPKLLIDVLSRLEAEQRRRLIVTGGTMEWFGKENVAVEVARADADNDRFISPKDFDNWFANALRRRGKERGRQAQSTSPTLAAAGGVSAAATSASLKGGIGKQSAPVSAPTVSTVCPSPSTTPQNDGTANTAGDVVAGAAQQESEEKVPLATLLLVVLEAALPFVGFGFLDNAIMITAGDVIDGTIGLYFNCTVMASAAMGNVVSGAMGIQVHGLIDNIMLKLHVGAPPLTEKQRGSRRIFLAGHVGGTVGIIIGLTLGMLPLLFIKSDETKSDHAMFHKWDRDKNGVLERANIFDGLVELGLPQSEMLADQIMETYGSPDGLNVSQFAKLRDDMRNCKVVFNNPADPHHSPAGS